MQSNASPLGVKLAVPEITLFNGGGIIRVGLTQLADQLIVDGEATRKAKGPLARGESGAFHSGA